MKIINQIRFVIRLIIFLLYEVIFFDKIPSYSVRGVFDIDVMKRILYDLNSLGDQIIKVLFERGWVPVSPLKESNGVKGSASRNVLS